MKELDTEDGLLEYHCVEAAPVENAARHADGRKLNEGFKTLSAGPPGDNARSVQSTGVVKPVTHAEMLRSRAGRTSD